MEAERDTRTEQTSDPLYLGRQSWLNFFVFLCFLIIVFASRQRDIPNSKLYTFSLSFPFFLVVVVDLLYSAAKMWISFSFSISQHPFL